MAAAAAHVFPGRPCMAWGPGGGSGRGREGEARKGKRGRLWVMCLRSTVLFVYTAGGQPRAPRVGVMSLLCGREEGGRHLQGGKVTPRNGN